MVIRLTAVKSYLWFFAILLLALSFPLQVYSRTPYPALLPYLLAGLVVLLSLFPAVNSTLVVTNTHQNRNIGLMVGIYVFFVLLGTAAQVLIGVINYGEGMGALANYLLPVVFYWYFRKVATEREIRWVLIGMAVAGFIVGAYFAYDSYLKLALGQVSDYNRAAFQYSLERANVPIEKVSQYRIAIASRSFGLLESHAVSGAWVLLGTFAAMSLIPQNFRAFRQVVILCFGTMIILGLNFTSIVAFVMIVGFFEFDFSSMCYGRCSRKGLLNTVRFAFVVTVVLGGILLLAGNAMTNYFFWILSAQKDVVLGTGDLNVSLIGILKFNFEKYFQHTLSVPLSILIGDGFSSYGMPKGGDVGFIESLAKFGLPLFLLIALGFLRLMLSGVRQINVKLWAQNGGGVGLDHGRLLQFAVSVTLLIIITEGHYTVWVAKSILPMVFFVLALYGRYLSMPHRGGDFAMDKL